jgi:hypothetical protein
LVTRGIGVGNGVASYTDERRSHGDAESVGANQPHDFLTYFLTVGAVALAAILLGLALARRRRGWWWRCGRRAAHPAARRAVPIPLLAAAAYAC